MDRRSFSKTLAALMAAPSVLLKPAASVASVPPVIARDLPSYFKDCIGHYGLNHIDITTSFNVSPMFETGLLETYEEPFEQPLIEVGLSFYLNREKTIERTVHFEGRKKSWVQLTDDRDEAVACHHRQGSLSLLDDLEHQPSHMRTYYSATSVKIYDPETGDEVMAMAVEIDQLYTIHIDIADTSDPTHPKCRTVLTDIKAINLTDYDQNEVDFQLKEH